MTYPTATIPHVAKPLTDHERQEILDLLASGKSCRQIAAEVGRSNDTVSRIAASVGHSFGQSNLARAHEARSAYSAERRALLAARFTEAAEKLLAQLEQPHVAFSFGGKENTYAEHTFDEPDAATKFTLVRGAREAMRTVLDIDRHDNRAEDGLAAVDAWLRDMLGEAS